MISINFSALLYLLASVLFILSLKGLSSPTSARKGNYFGIIGMAIAIITTILQPDTSNYFLIITAIIIGGVIGTSIALKIEMTAMPQLVAAFHSLVGFAAVLVAYTALLSPESYGIGNIGSIKTASRIEMSLGVAIGAITFTGSIIAFGKLQGLVSGAPLVFKGQHILNLLIGIIMVALIVLFSNNEDPRLFHILTILALLIGILLIIPIGGADMPVVVSMLNSYSGWAAAGIGFTLQNTALIIVGALVGSSGAILSYIMCKAMNRSFISVILGGFGAAIEDEKTGNKNKNAKAGSAEDAAFIMQNSQNVVIVPGYGMAVAQAQHIVREMTDKLKSSGVSVKYAIHPVAGRMPGHMNVLLAEADVDYSKLIELDQANEEFKSTDVAVIIGANDVVNPDAIDDSSSPLFGMPILKVWESTSTVVLKRSMSAGYAGVQNPLFFKENNKMYFGDAKESLQRLSTELKNL